MCMLWLGKSHAFPTITFEPRRLRTSTRFIMINFAVAITPLYNPRRYDTIVDLVTLAHLCISMPGSPFKRYPNQTFDIEGFFDTMDRAGNLNMLARLIHFYFAVPIAPLLAVIAFDAHCSQGSDIVNFYSHAIQGFPEIYCF